MDRLGLLGVTAEQIRQKQRKDRLDRQQSLFSQARTPEQLSGMAIASLIGSLGRGLFGKPSQAEQDAQLREQIYGETDFEDVNSILGSADVLRSTDPKAAAQYELFAKNYLAEQKKAEQAAADYQREVLGTRLDLAQKGVDLQQSMKDLNAVDAPKALTFEQLKEGVGAYITADPANRFSSLRDQTGNFFTKKDDEELIPFITNQTALILRANPGMKIDEAFAQASAGLTSLIDLGKEPADVQGTGSDAYQDMAGNQETTETVQPTSGQMGRRKRAKQQAEAVQSVDTSEQRAKLQNIIETSKSRRAVNKAKLALKQLDKLQGK